MAMGRLHFGFGGDSDRRDLDARCFAAGSRNPNNGHGARDDLSFIYLGGFVFTI